MSKKNLFLICFLMTLSFNQRISADVVGSDTAVSVVPAYTFPTGVDNRIANFGFIKNGFTFADSLTTCTFDSVFPVSGGVQLNGGTLYLNQDLLFSNITDLEGLGTIIGNNHLLDFCSSVQSFPGNTSLFVNTILSLNTHIILDDAITFSGICQLNGRGNNLIMDPDASITIASGSTLLLKDITVENVEGMNINLADDTSQLILHNVALELISSFTFNYGSFLCIGDVLITGSYAFFYTSSQTSTITKDANLIFADQAILSIGMQNVDAPVQPLAFADLSSVLMFDNATLSVNPNGVQFIAGTVVTMRDVEVDVASTSSSTGLILGDGTQQGDMVFDMYPGCSVNYTGGAVVYNVTNGNGILANSDTVDLVRADASIFWLNQNVTLANMSIDVGDGSTLYVAPNVTLDYSNATMNTPEGSFELNGTRYNSYTTLLSGNQSIFMIKGYLPMYTMIASTGNAIQGNGNIGGAIILQDENAELIWGLEGNLLNTMYMNNGSLVLASNFVCANGVQFSGPGTIHLSNNSFILGQNDLNWTDAIYWDGTNGVLSINSDVTLSNTWTFSGQCILDCNNNILDLTNGNIIVERGSTLTIKNAKMQNIANTSITCLDNFSSLVLNNVSWIQSNNSIFPLGSLQFKNNVEMGGVGIFAYQSDQTVTIGQHSTLTLDQNFTFSYDEVNSGLSNLLVFTDTTSQLILNSATVYATGPGVQLTNGTLKINGNSSCASENSSAFENPGIILGDCNGADDVICIISAGSQLTLLQGSLQYKNVNASSFIMLNSLASLYIGDNASLYLYQNLNGAGLTYFGNNATLGENPSAQLLMGVVQVGTLNNVTSSSC